MILGNGEKANETKLCWTTTETRPESYSLFKLVDLLVIKSQFWRERKGERDTGEGVKGKRGRKKERERVEGRERW